METSSGVPPARLSGWATPWPGAAVVMKESTVSTMSDALLLARSGCPPGTVAAALFQEQGRGRVSGRTWQAPVGSSLLATVVLRVSELGFPLEELPLRAGTAAALGIEDAAGIRIQIKWPNDLMWAPAGAAAGAATARKIAGLLCEAHGDAALVGFGVNCGQASFPDPLAATACSLLQACGHALEPSTVLSAILLRLKSAPELAAWRDVLRSRLYRRGEAVRVDLLGAGAVVEGRLVDVDEGGRLVLELSDGRRQTVAQGELMSSPE